MTSRWILALVPVFLATTPAFAETPQSVDWNAAARQDLAYAAETIRARHAGVVAGRLEATAALDSGLRSAEAEVGSVATRTGYLRLMTRLIAGFGDPHTGIGLHLKTSGWTGLVLDRVGNGFEVIWSEPGWPHPLPPKGAKVEACDGVWIGTYLAASVAPFVNNALEYPTTQSELARRSMFDSGLGYTPHACRFRLASGETRDWDLPLSPVPEAVSAERIEAVGRLYKARARPVGLYPLAGGNSWVGMPNFDGAKSGAAYEHLYEALEKLPHRGWVVFDLRGNGGGDSSWGSRALAALYGKDYAATLEQAPASAKSMIADQASIDLFESFMAKPEFAASLPEFTNAVARMKAAREKGLKLARTEETPAAEFAANAAAAAKRPDGPRLAAVIDRNCFSSCMNFLQQLEAIGDTLVLGEPTIGYSPYGEIGQYELPSGLGALYLPSAFYESPQPTRAPFLPTVAYPGSMADDSALTAWVEERIRTEH